ncbi:hypothetical protein [Alkaliphilus sp. B6464]|uniref:hypothetical protein n=1 Tax=Alkaliphilus sp. B6464 TaxID=2731219 RepID=UPI001BA5641A|nr:hypothetical protein [Alkaliphilus sp. B6464]QUH21841.1 hypothetical protein HYG84_18060 [Alkaliphilus sp. B6464]
MKSLSSLKKGELFNVLAEILNHHKDLKRTVEEGKWYVDDSEFGLYVKAVLENHRLIEPETIND